MIEKTFSKSHLRTKTNLLQFKAALHWSSNSCLSRSTWLRWSTRIIRTHVILRSAATTNKTQWLTLLLYACPPSLEIEDAQNCQSQSTQEELKKGISQCRSKSMLLVAKETKSTGDSARCRSARTCAFRNASRKLTELQKHIWLTQWCKLWSLLLKTHCLNQKDNKWRLTSILSSKRSMHVLKNLLVEIKVKVSDVSTK